MGRWLSRLTLELILTVSVLALVRLPPTVISTPQALYEPNMKLPTLPQQETYHDFWYYLKQWMATSVPQPIRQEWGSFTSGVERFEFLPKVEGAAITRVQGPAKGTASSGSTVSVTLLQTPTAGDILVAAVLSINANSGSHLTVSTISQTDVVWTQQTSGTWASPTPYLDLSIWAGVVSAGASTSISVNLSGPIGSSGGGAVADVCEYSGLVTSGFLDQTAHDNPTSTSSSTNTGTTATTTQASELVVGATVGWMSSSQSQSSPTNGFTLLDGANFASNGDDMSLAYLENIVSSTGTYSSATSLQVSGWWAGCIATFKATTAPPPPPPASFAVTASPTSQSIGAGGTASSALTVTAGGGFTGTVNLSVTSGCPSSAACSVSPNSINTSGTATLTVATSITTTSGTFPVVVTGTSGSLSNQVTFTVTVTAAPTFNFNVLSTSVQVVVTVTWVGSPGTASVTIAGPGGSPTYSESGAIVYNSISYISGGSPPTNIHRVTFTLSSPTAGVWTAYVSQPGATVTIEVS